MPLPESYLEYPCRAYGSDHDRYAWRLRSARPRIGWPGNLPVAALLVIPLEFHRLNPAVKPFKPPGSMVTPYPDLRNFSSRDYGNRVGVFRLLAALRTGGLKATFAINAELLAHIGPLLEVILSDGHEIAAHGMAADAIHWSGLEESAEQAMVMQALRAFHAVGIRPRTWMSPARQQSARTLDLLAAADIEVCLDWESDSVPITLRTRHGDLVAVPLSSELDDRVLLSDRRQNEHEWVQQIAAAAQLLREEAPGFGGQVLSLSMTPYLAGLPFRMPAVREIVRVLARANGIWSATAAEIADAAGLQAKPPAATP